MVEQQRAESVGLDHRAACTVVHDHGIAEGQALDMGKGLREDGIDGDHHVASRAGASLHSSRDRAARPAAPGAGPLGACPGLSLEPTSHAPVLARSAEAGHFAG